MFTGRMLFLTPDQQLQSTEGNEVEVWRTMHWGGITSGGENRGRPTSLDLFVKRPFRRGSVAEWLACWTQAQKGPGSNCSRDAVG